MRTSAMLFAALLAAAAAGAETPGRSPTAQPKMMLLTGKPASVTGFRDAYWGMNVAEVRAKASLDFAIPPHLIVSLPADRVAPGKTAIALRVSRLDPAPGPAMIVYSFTDGRLDGVELRWALPASADAAARKALLDPARLLAGDLRSRSWKLGTELAGVPAGDALIVFAGGDQAGAGVELRLTGVPYQVYEADGVTLADAPASDGPAMLRMAYAAHVAQRPIPPAQGAALQRTTAR